jgi:hypothetical protein
VGSEVVACRPPPSVGVSGGGGGGGGAGDVSGLVTSLSFSALESISGLIVARGRQAGSVAARQLAMPYITLMHTVALAFAGLALDRQANATLFLVPLTAALGLQMLVAAMMVVRLGTCWKIATLRCLAALLLLIFAGLCAGKGDGNIGPSVPWVGVFAPLWVVIALHLVERVMAAGGELSVAERLLRLLPGFLNIAFPLVAFTILAALRLDGSIALSATVVFTPLFYLCIYMMCVLPCSVYRESEAEHHLRKVLPAAVTSFFLALSFTIAVILVDLRISRSTGASYLACLAPVVVNLLILFAISCKVYPQAQRNFVAAIDHVQMNPARVYLFLLQNGAVLEEDV